MAAHRGKWHFYADGALDCYRRYCSYMKHPKEVFRVYLILKLMMISMRMARRRELVRLNRVSPSISASLGMLLQLVRWVESLHILHNIFLRVIYKLIDHLQTVTIPNAYEDPRFDPSVDENSSFKHKSILCMAIKNSLGQIIGVIQLINKFDDLVSCMAIIAYVDPVS